MAAHYPCANRMKTLDSDAAIPTHRLAWDRTTGRHGKQKTTDLFIKGPIPLDWVTRANALPGKAGAVGIALWFLAGVKTSKTFKVTAEARRVAACSRQAFSHGLDALEDAKLISVVRRAGCNPEVSMRSVRIASS
jgi:hypothetical protein